MCRDIPTGIPLRYSSSRLSNPSENLSSPQSSLVITRNLSVTDDATQLYVPVRYLLGLLPAALLDNYVFWQNKDDSLTGYMKKEQKADKQESESTGCVFIFGSGKQGALQGPEKKEESSKAETQIRIALIKSGTEG